MNTTYYFTCARHKIQLTGTPIFSVGGETEDGAKVWTIDLSEMECPLYVPITIVSTIEELMNAATEPDECQNDWAIITATVKHEVNDDVSPT
jgi:hypothetical protein